MKNEIINSVYVLKSRTTGLYLKYFKSIKFNHYVADFNEATRFDYKEAYRRKKMFKHPENWIIRRVKNGKR